jgi:hypothetical protein
MSIILLILKIIGIIVLLLLILLLILLLLVLLVPVRYRVSGKIENEAAVHGTVSWLMHLVQVSLVFEQGEFASVIRIFGIRLGKKAKDKDKKQEKRMDAGADSDIDGYMSAGADDNIDADMSADAENNADDDIDADMKSNAESDTDSDIDGYMNADTEHIAGKGNEAWHMLSGVRTNMRNGIGKVKDFCKKEEVLRRELTSEDNRKVLGQVLNELFYLLRHFKFREIDTELYFSAGDPAVTGQVLGGLCVLPFLYQYDFCIYPDFEADAAYLKGTFLVKGRARLVHVLKSFICLIRQKEVRNLLRRL